MRGLILAGLLAASGAGVTATPSSAIAPQGFSLANAFRMPRAEAFGAAFGAVAAVHLFAKMRTSRNARRP